MATDEIKAGEFAVTLDEQERSELLQLLKQSLAETRVEVHHTHTPDFRDQVQRREELLRRLIAKIQGSGS
jgi:hypothetical protein